MSINIANENVGGNLEANANVEVVNIKQERLTCQIIVCIFVPYESICSLPDYS